LFLITVDLQGQVNIALAYKMSANLAALFFLSRYIKQIKIKMLLSLNQVILKLATKSSRCVIFVFPGVIIYIE